MPGALGLLTPRAAGTARRDAPTLPAMDTGTYFATVRAAGTALAVMLLSLAVAEAAVDGVWVFVLAALLTFAGSWAAATLVNPHGRR